MLSTSEELAKRLQDAFSRTGKTKAAFARECQQSPQTVNSWLKTGRIDKMKLVLFAQVAGVPLEDLIGKTPAPFAKPQSPSPTATLQDRAGEYRGAWPFASFSAADFHALPAESRFAAEVFIQGLIAANHVKSNSTPRAA